MGDDGKSGGELGRRLVRYGRVSGAAAGLAARIAGERYLGLKIERDAHARELLEAMGGLKGPLMKIGQILATIPEALPPEYARAFQELQASAPPMGWPFVRRRMRAELGAGWESRFKSFEKTAAAAASLGQVHRAVAHDGQELACKLQYPDMESTVRADLNQLRLILSVYERYDSAVRTSSVHEELTARLFEELDYLREARHGKMYAHMLRGESGVHVPAIVDDLTTKRLLTAAWLEGAPILSLVGASAARRNAVALNMFRAWYIPFYRYGIIHGDPHPGNYTIRGDDSVNLLDFGCIRVFPPSFAGGVIDLYRALMTNDRDRAVHAYETWGFRGLNKEQIETLDIWARFLYAPVMDDRVRTIGEAKGGFYGRETAREVHRKLREAGGVSVPREFVFMDRAALGLGSVFIHLGAEINWYRLFNEMIADFDEEEMRGRQERLLEKSGL